MGGRERNKGGQKGSTHTSALSHWPRNNAKQQTLLLSSTVHHKIGQWDCKGGRAEEGKRVLECTLKIERQKEVREGGSRKKSGVTWRNQLVEMRGILQTAAAAGTKETNLNISSARKSRYESPGGFYPTLIPVRSRNPTTHKAARNNMHQLQMKNDSETQGDGFDVRVHTHLCSQIHT